jgi:hypothetical protein
MQLDANVLYPKAEDEDEYRGWRDSYQPIIDALGEVLVQVDDQDYQGDSRVLLKGADGRFGHLQFGWGSCSGCDALQACDTRQELQELIDHIAGSVKWFDSPEEALGYFLTHDWEGDYSWRQEEQKEYVKKAVEALQG